MYPRNAASPERIAVGAVVQISDGAVQTSGVSISVRGQGGSSGAGSGTTAYDNGIVQYTPTQGETDFTSFVVVAYKTGCIPATVTVVTTASSVPGRTMPADGSVTAAVVATDAIDADALKADAVTEIQSGLATAANLATVAGYLDTEIAAILADTNELQTDWADGGRLDLILDQIAADLPQRVTKNTALAKFPFKMVDSTDHITAETGLTITATRSLDGASFASCANSASEIGSGWYYIDLAAGDLNGNTVILKFTATGADTREITIITQPT